MKKIFVIISILMILVLMLTACGNRQIYDTTYRFNRAIIDLRNGNIIEGEVQSWTDFDNGDQLQVKIDGVTYLTSAENVILISD